MIRQEKKRLGSNISTIIICGRVSAKRIANTAESSGAIASAKLSKKAKARITNTQAHTVFTQKLLLGLVAGVPICSEALR